MAKKGPQSAARKRYLAMRKEKREAHFFRSVNDDFVRKEWSKILEEFDYQCAYCLKHLKSSLTRDHVTPLSRGGNHTASNIVPACKNCNISKGSMTLEEWFGQAPDVESQVVILEADTLKLCDEPSVQVNSDC